MSDDISRLLQRIEREIAHLKCVRARLLEGTHDVTAEWVRRNADEPLLIDRLNSFGMQVGRTAESVTKHGKPIGKLAPWGQLRKPVDLTRLQRVTGTMPRQSDDVGRFMRQLRDDARY